MTTIKLRRDTASNWFTANPVLAEGEVGIETDTNKQKIGDGVTNWNNLPYLINYGSFNSPIEAYSDTSVSWDKTKLVYNSTTKVFTPTDTVTDGTYESKHAVTFTVPDGVNIDSYSDNWSITIPNAVFTQSSNDTSNLICFIIYAQDVAISRLWYGASNWRLGASASTAYMPNNYPWGVKHSTATYNEPSATSLDGSSFDPYNNNFSKSMAISSNSGRINKVVVYVNSQMNTNVPVGDIVLNKLDGSDNVVDSYPLFVESSQKQIRLKYNSNNLTIDANNQLNTTQDLSSFLTGITSSDVITALGYTPVNKAGDTMSGQLKIKKSGMGYQYLCSDIDFTTAPSSNKSGQGFQISDKNENRMARLEYTHVSNGGHYLSISDKKSNSENEYSKILLGWYSSGLAYATAPAPSAGSNGDNIATTAWVKDFAKTSGNSYMSTFSQGANGYYKFTNGLIIQWGNEQILNGEATVTLPTAFTSVNYNVSLTAGGVSNSTMYMDGKTQTAFIVKSSSDTGFEWLAIGY